MNVVLWMFVLAQGCPQPVAYPMGDSVEANEVLAARIAIEMLRAGASASIRDSGQKIFVVEGQVMTYEEFARFLVALPKPTRCEAVERSGRVTVHCAEIAAGPLLKAQRERTRLTDWRTSITSFASIDLQREPRVLIIGPEARLVIPLRALEAFERDYRIAGSLALFEPTPADEAAGLHARIEIRRAARVEFLGSLPPK